MRLVPAAVRAELEKSSSAEVWLVFGEIRHPSLIDPIRVVSENDAGISYANGLPINYYYLGDLYQGLPFAFDLLSDGEQAPRSTITVPNVRREIGKAALLLTDSPRLFITIVPLSAYTLTVGASNARNHASPEPTVIYAARHLFLRNVSGDSIAVQADVEGYDLTAEPWPAVRTTPEKTPALYA